MSDNKPEQYTTIKEAFEDYRAHVMPEDPDPIQLHETRKGFYAGSMAILRMAWDIGCLDDEAEQEKQINALLTEQREFATAAHKQEREWLDEANKKELLKAVRDGLDMQSKPQ